MQVLGRDLGRTDYQTTLKAMQTFTTNRTVQTLDECWLTEHDSVYTLGLNRQGIRLPDTTIPVVPVDRGGKITYHGIGQVIIYVLVDLQRRQLNVRQLVHIMETSIVDLLARNNMHAETQKNMPGVYVWVDDQHKKIASLGLRLKNQCSYHGLSLNVDMDLSPFAAIDPCGYAGLQMTQTKDLGIKQTSHELGQALLQIVKEKLADD